MPRHTPPYPEEFRLEAVRLAKLGGKPRWKLAEELGITAVTLRKWLRQDQAEEEARREAEARARREGEENAPPGARGQVSLRPDSDVGAGPATASDAVSRVDGTAGSPRRANVEVESAPRDDAAHRGQRREVAQPGGTRGRLRGTHPGRMAGRRTRLLLVAAGVILSATVAAVIAVAMTVSGRVATTATSQPSPLTTTTATELVVARPAIAVGGFPDAVAMGLGKVWVANAADDTVSRLDPGSGRVVGEPIAVGAFPDAIAVGDGSVWIANADDNTVTRLDATIGRVVGEPIAVGAFPDAIAVGDGSVWIANADDNTVTRLDATASGDGRDRRRAGDPPGRGPLVSRRPSPGRRVGMGREREQQHGRTTGRQDREADRPTGTRGRPPTRRGRGGRLRVGLKFGRGHGLADRRELRKGRGPANPSRRASDQHRGGTGLGVGRECGRQHDLAAWHGPRHGGWRLGRLAVDRVLSQRDAPSGRSPPRHTSLRRVGALARPSRGSSVAPRRGTGR